MKRRIRLSEGKLHRIIKESVRRILREYKSDRQGLTFDIFVPFLDDSVEVWASVFVYNDPDVNSEGFEIEDYDVVDDNLSSDEKDQVFDWIEENMDEFEEKAGEAYDDYLDYRQGEEDDYYDGLSRKQHYGY